MQMDGTPGQPTPIDAALLMMRLLFAGLVTSVIVYVVIIHVVVQGEPAEVEQPLAMSLAGAAVFFGLLAPIARRMLMPERAPDRPGAGPPPGVISPRGFGRAFAAHIVSWALCESVAIMGVVLAFLGRDPEVLYPFAAGAVLMFVFLAPRRSELEAVARAEGPGGGP